MSVNNVQYLKKKFKLSFADILSTCQLHISLTRTAQIYLELHFCVELHTKKVLFGTLGIAIRLLRITGYNPQNLHFGSE